MKTFPMPGDRCGFKLGKRYINGIVTSVTLHLKRTTQVQVHVKKAWKTKHRTYRVPLRNVAGWYSMVPK